ncbi:MAG TPA: succinate dehydrogenase, cytochrome b556 subunit [Gammaproteobacteria bacterium]
MNRTPRPVYRNLLEFRFPATAITSLLHRMSGALLFLALPISIYGLDHSLQGGGMADLQRLWQLWPLRLAVALSGWALLHHWLAGWRFLFLDVDLGSTLTTARFTARLLNTISVAGLLFIVGLLL